MWGALSITVAIYWRFGRAGGGIFRFGGGLLSTGRGYLWGILKSMFHRYSHDSRPLSMSLASLGE